MTLLRKHFAYHDCTSSELRHFVESRTKQTLADTDKAGLVSRLQALDAEAKFPFLSLPRELRLIVYDELPFHPQILAVSKGIHEEAKPIFDGRSMVTRLQIAAREAPMISINNGPWIFLPHKAVTADEVFKQLQRWPREITQARHLEVEVECSGDVRSQAQINSLLYSLATLLHSSSSEIQLRAMSLTSLSHQSSGLLHHIFWPLLRLGPKVELKLHSSFPTHWVASFSKKFLRPSTRSTALHQHVDYKTRVISVINLAKKAGIPWRCSQLYAALRVLDRQSLDNLMFSELSESAWKRTLERSEREVVDEGSYRMIQKEAESILARRDRER